MNGTIKRLLGSSLFLALCSITALYVGSRQARRANVATPQTYSPNNSAQTPADGLVLAGGFFMILAFAVAFAGAMLWMREGKT